MSRRLSAAVAALLFAAAARPASALTLDEVIQKNLQARGGLEKIRTVTSVRMTGTFVIEKGSEAPFKLEMKRPDKMRSEFTLQGKTAVQGFDGKVAWAVSPHTGQPEAFALPAEESRDAAEQADMDGPLVDWKAKGHKVELLGKGKAGKADAWKVKVSLKGGDVRTLYLDARTFLEVRSEFTRMINGTPVQFTSTIGDYRDVGGLVLPHSIESGAKDMGPSQKMTFSKIELNPALDDGRFSMPGGKK